MKMNILYSADDLYSKLVLVSLKSVFMNNIDAEEINVYIVEDGIKEENRSLIRDLGNNYKRNIQFIPLAEKYTKVYSTIAGRARAAAAVYSYCYIQDILPQNINKVLLLEGDCLVLGSLKELYETDLTGCYFAAVDDLQSKWMKKKLGINPDSPYVNSGVVLFNLKEMRRDNFSEKITTILQEGNSEFFYEAQDELNVLSEGKVKVLPPKYNGMTAVYLFDKYENMLRYRRPSTKCTKEEFYEAKEHPVIVHFTKNRIIQPRPWIEECTHPFKQRYLDVRADTAIANEELWERKKSGIGRVFTWLYFHGAQGLVALILGPVHAVLFPMFLYRYL